MKVDRRIIILLLLLVAICIADTSIIPRASKESIVINSYSKIVKNTRKSKVIEYFVVDKEGEIYKTDLSTFGHLPIGSKFTISKSKLLGIQKQLTYSKNDEIINVSAGRFTKSLDTILLIDFILLSVAFLISLLKKDNTRELLSPIALISILFGIFTFILILIDFFID